MSIGRPATGPTPVPLVVGHRGASGYRPEHTIASYELAARIGADYLDVDLVPTRDGVLVCRHDPEIGRTTDVADRAEFSARKRTAQVADDAVTGWFVEDFSAAEVSALGAVERLPDVRQHNTMWDGRQGVPTLDDVLALRAHLSAELGREIGVYPELKHPARFAALGLPVTRLLADALRRHGVDDAAAPAVVQCFDAAALRELDDWGIRTRRALLVPPAVDLSTADLAHIAEYADILAPEKSLVIGRDEEGALGRPTGLVEAAHAAGLLVHPFTFRAENAYLPTDYRSSTPGETGDFGRGIDEIVAYLRTGVDGVFTDQPDVAVAARAHVLATR